MERAYDIEKRGGRIRALTELMRGCGLRIRDAVTLEKTRLLPNDDLFLYQAKTGVPVYVPLPHHVAERLRNIPPGPKPNPRYFFWSGNGDPKSAVAGWQRSFRRLFEIVKLEAADGTAKRCFPHMFRDTFAVENLLAGVPIDQVSLLLGHKSVRITEKHYAPFVKARQEQLQEVLGFLSHNGVTGSSPLVALNCVSCLIHRLTHGQRIGAGHSIVTNGE
jgi:integrase